ncbi:MAG: rcc01693 family protein [Allorhizobium sp.]
MNGGATETERKPKKFPWDAALHAGLCRLRLDPRIFWALTPIELDAMAGGRAPASDGFSRGRFLALMQRFPDGRSF